jgi:GNAT superfamily N-acetyltransferase
MTPSLLPVDLHRHRALLIDLHTEYLEWVFAEIAKEFNLPEGPVAGMTVPEYIAAHLDAMYGESPAPAGYYLLMSGDVVAGMAGWRTIRPGVAEIKRLFVRPACRGQQLGQIALEQLMAEARAEGCRSMCLDTAPFMLAAHRLYEANGFRDCVMYPETEVPPEFFARWRFMQRALDS